MPSASPASGSPAFDAILQPPASVRRVESLPPSANSVRRSLVWHEEPPLRAEAPFAVSAISFLPCRSSIACSVCCRRGLHCGVLSPHSCCPIAASAGVFCFSIQCGNVWSLYPLSVISPCTYFIQTKQTVNNSYAHYCYSIECVTKIIIFVIFNNSLMKKMIGLDLPSSRCPKRSFSLRKGDHGKGPSCNN